MNSVSRSKKELLKEQIDKLDNREHDQVYKIIQKYTDQFTKTQNGVLVSTDVLNDACLEEIELYINFCLAQKKRIEDDLKIRKNYEKFGGNISL